jgi:WD40 repeat protein
MTDMTWEVTNDGNAAVAYSLNLREAGVLPEELIFQLMVYRVYTTPVSNGCELTEEAQHELLVNVNDPNFAPLSLFDPNVDDPDVVSFYLEPGDSALITLRVFDPDADNQDVFNPADVQPAVVAQGVNTEDVLLGDTQPPFDVPDASIPMPYTMNAGRSTQTSTVLPDGRVLVAGGFNPLQDENTAEIYDPSTRQFTPTGSMAVPRRFHTATLLDDGTVLVVGRPSGGLSGPSAEIYDPLSGTFAATSADLNVPRGSHRATKLPDGRVLITGGDSSGLGFLNSAEIYDPSTGGFQLLPSTMAQARAEHTATLLTNGRVLIAGGWGGPAMSLDTAELFDPVTSAFTTVGDSLVEARRFHTATLLPNGSVLIAGGIVSGPSFASTANAETYDPASGLFAPAGSMSDARAGHIAEILPGGKILIAGGNDGLGATLRLIPSVDVYDWSTNSFSYTGQLAEARVDHSAARLANGDILITGGTTPGPPVINGTDSFEIYHPGLPPKFLRSGSLDEGRNYHAVEALLDGDVLVVGGSQDAISAIASIERYDVALGTFATVETMTTPRMYPTATRLNDGTVLIAGGLEGVGGNILNTALIYDPNGNTLTPTSGPMQASRYSHTATLLQDGRVLLVGGRGNTGVLFSTEIYDPSSGMFSWSDSLTSDRMSHTATLLNDGRVLIAGGDGTADVENTFQVWNSGTFGAEGVMNDYRARASATLLVDGSVLIAGGRDGGWNSLATAEIFDPIGGTFTYTHGAMKLARRTHASIRLPSGQILIAGGAGDGSVLFSAAEVYDPVTQTFELTDVLNVARSSPQAAPLPDGGVLLVGGWKYYGGGLTVPARTAEIFDVSDLTGFFSTSSSSTPRYRVGSTLLANGEVLVAGGAQDGSPFPTLFTTAERYDPITGSFRPTGSLNQGRYGFAETRLADGKVLIVGGLFGGNPGLGEVYDPNTGVFTPTVGNSNAHLAPTATLLPSGEVLVVGAGGVCPIAFPNSEIFDPASTTFAAPTGDLNTRRGYHTATMLPNGKVLIAGGITCGSTLSSAELYDPVTRSFTDSGDTMSSPREGHTATLLASGEVLITGGHDGSTRLSSAELYDPLTDTFYDVSGTMGSPRGGHFSALLPNGKVLVGGGFDDGLNPYSNTELYDPYTDSFSPHFEMTTSRGNQSAVSLANGWVLVVGGWDGATELATAEIYLPGAP